MSEENTTREDFAIKGSLIMMELEGMLERIKKVESQLILVDGVGLSNGISDTDFFNPDKEVKLYEPPKKRMKPNDE